MGGGLQPRTSRRTMRPATWREYAMERHVPSAQRAVASRLVYIGTWHDTAVEAAVACAKHAAGVVEEEDDEEGKDNDEMEAEEEGAVVTEAEGWQPLFLKTNKNRVYGCAAQDASSAETKCWRQARQECSHRHV